MGRLVCTDLNGTVHVADSELLAVGTGADTRYSVLVTRQSLNLKVKHKRRKSNGK